MNDDILMINDPPPLKLRPGKLLEIGNEEMGTGNQELTSSTASTSGTPST